MSSTTDPEQTPNPPANIQEVLNEFAAGQVEPGRVTEMTDPTREQVREFSTHWPELPVATRREVIREMSRQKDENLALSFNRYFRIALIDQDAEIRALAVQNLWEDDSLSFLHELGEMAEREDEAAVQEAVAIALAQFSYLVETEELDDESAAITQRALFRLMSDGKNWMVRRRALESAAFMSQNQRIKDAIAEAADSDFEQERAGALIAMGRNLDECWFPTIVKELGNEDPDIRCEAARAAGLYGDPAAIDPLSRLVDDEDDEIPHVAVEAIGRIGGQKAIDTLKYLETQVSGELSETLEAALDEAIFLSEATGLED